jgi:hypothetical protein
MLFEMLSDVEDEWQGMPEFTQEDQTSHRKVIVHFRSDADVDEFAALLSQRIGPKQPSIWYPEMAHRVTADKHYVDGGE